MFVFATAQSRQVVVAVRIVVGVKNTHNQVLRTERDRVELQTDGQNVVRQHQFAFGTAQWSRPQFLRALKFVLGIVGVGNVGGSKSGTHKLVAPFLAVFHFFDHNAVGAEKDFRAIVGNDDMHVGNFH